jgi:hypothetical protein
VQLVPLSQMTVHKNRLLVAAVAAAGASLIAVTPMTPSTDLSTVSHRAVKLAAGEETWSEVVAASEGYLSDLQTNGATASTELSTASSALSGEFGGQFTTAFTGFETGVENAIDGGWYGSDDGYVEGLFPGTIIGGPDSPFTSIGTLAEISNALQAGDSEQAFSYVDTYFLELLDHTLKPLLSPLLDETSHGATTLSIPVELSQLQTNLLETFGTYNELKAFGDATSSPFLGAGFGFFQDIGNIQTDLAGGDYTQALTDLQNLPSDVTGDFLNGFPSAGEPFTGLLSFSDNPADASILQDLLVVWPEQLAQALTESTSAAAAEAVSTSAPDVLSGLLSF